MKINKNTAVICITVAVCCIAMGIVDAVIQPVYTVKSGVKLLLFLICPILYARLSGNKTVKNIFKPGKSALLTALAICIPLYALIVGGYFLLRGVFDFSNITSALTGNIGVNKQNFVFVALYISFINSLLEEFFFRGFAFLTLKKHAGRAFAHIFSALAFALYHIAMMTGWFSIWLYMLIIAGLFAGGVIFNLLNERTGNIYTSWFVHMSANFAINTVGFILFGII